MRRAKTKLSRSLRPRRRKAETYSAMPKHAEELMELAVEAAQSRHLPEFLEQFARRAARMLDAVWGGVAVYRGRETELYSMAGSSDPTFPGGADWLISRALECPNNVESRAIPKEIAAALQFPGDPGTAVFVRIAASDNERLGTLCLFRRRKSLSAETGSDLACPFCQDTQRTREEYVAASAERIFLVSTSRTPGISDDDTRTIHVLKDITDRREAERRYRELFDSIQEGLFFATPEGRFLDVNDAMVRMLGYGSREELLRADVSPHLYPAPEARAKFLGALSERGVLRNYEETLRRKDGTLLHTLQSITAVRDTCGHIAQIRGLMLDVTEQKTFQSQLQRERDFNQKILNTTQSMILVLDTAGLISYANRRCYEAGYQESELIGHRLVDWVEGSHREDFDAALETTANGHQVENLELRVRRSDGSMGHFSISLSPMRDEQNTVNSVVVVMTDITDAALLQAKLAHSEKMATIGRLVSGVAHEVNNPLAAILGFTDLLLENPEVPVNAKEDLQIILHETQRTKDIVQDLLSFARQRPARREAVQVNAVLRQTIKLRSYDFASHGVEVIETMEENLEPVLGDAQQLQQVFLNILNNAYDAVQETQRRGQIEIRTARSAHGGEIQCWNNDGEGSTFVVRLPAATEAGIATAKEAGR